MMRLDKYLVENGYFETRHQAQNAIKDGHVTIDSRVVMKPAFKVTKTHQIELLSTVNPYVSRGGLKLQTAIELFDLDVRNKAILDIGASHGGFTDCLLNHGAQAVLAIDVGRDQLHASLRKDERVTLMEETNFLSLSETKIKAFDAAVMDVSFTSSIPLITYLFSIKPMPLVVLIKPQFEQNANTHKGMIKHRRVHVNILNHYIETLAKQEIFIQKLIPSPIRGSGGEIEFLGYFDEQNKPATMAVKSVVDRAYEEA